jgi:hypothetical protein
MRALATAGAPYAQPIDASPLSRSAEVPPGHYYYFVVEVDPDNANEHTACFGQNSRYNVDSEALERSNGGCADLRHSQFVTLA